MDSRLIGKMALDQYLTFPLLVTASILVFTWLLLRLWNQNRKLPPGPWGLPFFGFYPFLSSTPFKELTPMGKVYGNVFSFRTLGGRLVIVLNGTKTIKEVMVNRADEFIGRPHGANSISFVSDGIGILQEEGEKWKEQRKFFLSTVKMFGIGKLELERRIHDEIEDLLETLRKTEGKDTEMRFHITYVNNNVISQVLFNKKFSKDEFYERLSPAFDDIFRIFLGKQHLLIGYLFSIIFFLAPGLRKARQGRDYLRRVTADIIEEHIRTLDPTLSRDYVDQYLLQRKSLMENGNNKEGSFTMEKLQANALNLLLEAQGASVVDYIVELSKYQDVQKMAQKELDALVGRERLPSWADRTKLPYLEATIQELQRIATPFLVSTMYSNFEETTIEGFRIPKRSIIVFNAGTVHFDPEYYPNPHQFDPHRFLDSDGKRVKREGPYPFGIGKRSCVGESLAQMEIFLLIASILQNFTLYPGSIKKNVRLVPR